MQNVKKTDWKGTLFTAFQYILPQHLLSRWMGWVSDCQVSWIKNLLIRWWIKRFDVNMEEALCTDTSEYATFNQFFTRALKKEVRPFPEENQARFVSPCDGFISQQGAIDQGRIIQAKGFDFSVGELLVGNHELANEFNEGQFATIYLSPKDYHRVHMPCTGTLRKMIYVPGKLFSVNTTTSEHVPRLFARNERVVSIFDTTVGPIAIVMVGAMLVASIETVWAGEVAPIRRKINTIDYVPNESPIKLKQGSEMGRFKLGSTVIMLFAKGQVQQGFQFTAGNAVQLGQVLVSEQ